MRGGYSRGSESSGSSRFFILFPPHLLLAPFVLLSETREWFSAGARVEDVSIFPECFLRREESGWSEDAHVSPLWEVSRIKSKHLSYKFISCSAQTGDAAEPRVAFN